MPDAKPLNQTYHEAVEALKAKGVSNAEAIRQVAADLGKKENAVRAGIHQYKSKLSDGTQTVSRRARSQAQTLGVDDYLDHARQALESALGVITKEVDDAKAALDAAQVRYDEAVASVKDRKAEIEKKLKALA